MVRKKSDGAAALVGRPRGFDPDEVLDRAVELLWREGPTALSLNELAKRLGLAKPALARSFGGKEEFLAAVLKRYYERTAARVEAALAGAETVEEVARRYLEGFVALLSEKPVGPATGCLLAAATEASAAAEGGAVAETARTLNARSRAVLVDALHCAGAKDPEDLARFLYAQSVGLAFLSRTGAAADELLAVARRALSSLG